MTTYTDRLDPRLALTADERDRLIRQPDWLTALLAEADAAERAVVQINLDITERLARLASGVL